jgi:hypothetical protein
MLSQSLKVLSCTAVPIGTASPHPANSPKYRRVIIVRASRLSQGEPPTRIPAAVILSGFTPLSTPLFLTAGQPLARFRLVTLDARL